MLSLTKPEVAMLESVSTQERIGLFFNYQTEEYDLILYPLTLDLHTKAQIKALHSLLEKRILVRDGINTYVHPDHWIDVYGAEFRLSVCAMLQTEENSIIKTRDERRAEIDSIIDGSVSDWRLNTVWEVYTNNPRRHSDPNNDARFEAWISGGKRALAFHHAVTGAFDNYERSLQALARLMAYVQIIGVYRLMRSQTGLAFIT